MIISTYYYRKNDNKQNTEEKTHRKTNKTNSSLLRSESKKCGTICFDIYRLVFYFYFSIHINLLLYTRTLIRYNIVVLLNNIRE